MHACTKILVWHAKGEYQHFIIHFTKRYTCIQRFFRASFSKAESLRGYISCLSSVERIFHRGSLHLSVNVIKISKQVSSNSPARIKAFTRSNAFGSPHSPLWIIANKYSKGISREGPRCPPVMYDLESFVAILFVRGVREFVERKVIRCVCAFSFILVATFFSIVKMRMDSVKV